MKRAYLDRLQFDDTQPVPLGWHPACHAQVTALGGSWSLVAPWREAPDAVRLARPFQCIVLIDVPDHSLLTNVEPLGVEVEHKGLLRNALRQVRQMDLSTATKTRLRESGLDDTRATLDDVLRPLLEEPDVDPQR